jgi:hypothetical protein
VSAHSRLVAIGCPMTPRPTNPTSDFMATTLAFDPNDIEASLAVLRSVQLN